MLTKEVEKQLIDKAFEMKLKAYCPYSKYQVGAAVLTSSGKIYGGHNIENCAFMSCNCAEKTAMYRAIADGERNLVAIAICGGKMGEKPTGKETDSAFPCGLCRQVMSEFCKKDFKIYVCPCEDKYNVFTLEELFPHSFRPDNILN